MTITTTVRSLRDLQARLRDRRCDHLLLIKAAPAIVIASEAMSTSIASLDAVLALSVTTAVRDAVARAGTVDLRGTAPGIDSITDDVSRAISVRQLPIIYLAHVLAAVIVGVEQGLRDLLLNTMAKPARPAVVTDSKPFGMPAAPAAVSPTPDMGSADILDRLSSAPAPVSGPSRGRVGIRSDTERI